MTIKVAISGFGRIGRNVFRALYEYNRRDEIEVVAINDLGEPHVSAHLLQYDTVHGTFPFKVEMDGDYVVVDGDRIKLMAIPDPKKLPWGEMGVDVVMECTGVFRTREKAQPHIDAGAKKVIIGAPAKGGGVKTIVYGVNDDTLTSEDIMVSNASCTTNCLAPALKPIQDTFGIVRGMMTTVHSFTNDQVLTDVAHSDLRRARSAVQSMIPTTTGAAIALKLVIPELDGKIDGFSLRVPTINVSCADVNLILEKEPSVEELNACIEAAANSDTKLGKVLNYNEAPLVSRDFNHCPASSIFDGTQTIKIGNMYKILCWYDNEWGYSNRMIDTAIALMKAK
jgi:glyceraldehyde 3-phosphate dehydrogenase